MFARLMAGTAAALLIGLALAPAPALALDDGVQLAEHWGPYPPPPPPYWDHHRPPPPPPPYWDRPPRRWGEACYTTRGTCELEEAAPRDAPCRCFIPGFGPKRGRVI